MPHHTHDEPPAASWQIDMPTEHTEPPAELEMTTYERADGELTADAMWWCTTDAFDESEATLVIEKRWMLAEFRYLTLGDSELCTVCASEYTPCTHCGDTGEEPRIEPPYIQVAR